MSVLFSVMGLAVRQRMFSLHHVEQVGVLFNAARRDCDYCLGLGSNATNNQLVRCPVCIEARKGSGSRKALPTNVGIVDAIASAVEECWRIVLGRA